MIVLIIHSTVLMISYGTVRKQCYTVLHRTMKTISLSVSISASLCVCLYGCLSVPLCLSDYAQSVSLPVHMSVRLSVCRSVCACPYFCLFVCLCVCLSVRVQPVVEMRIGDNRPRGVTRGEREVIPNNGSRTNVGINMHFEIEIESHSGISTESDQVVLIPGSDSRIDL